MIIGNLQYVGYEDLMVFVYVTSLNLEVGYCMMT